MDPLWLLFVLAPGVRHSQKSVSVDFCSTLHAKCRWHVSLAKQRARTWLATVLGHSPPVWLIFNGFLFWLSKLYVCLSFCITLNVSSRVFPNLDSEIKSWTGSSSWWLTFQIFEKLALRELRAHNLNSLEPFVYNHAKTLSEVNETILHCRALGRSQRANIPQNGQERSRVCCQLRGNVGLYLCDCFCFL